MPETSKSIWKQTVELLKQHGCNTRGEKVTTKDVIKKKKQFFFEKRMLTNAVGNGKRQ
jgi:hypothetical protein